MKPQPFLQICRFSAHGAAGGVLCLPPPTARIEKTAFSGGLFDQTLSARTAFAAHLAKAHSMSILPLGF